MRPLSTAADCHRSSLPSPTQSPKQLKEKMFNSKFAAIAAYLSLLALVALSCSSFLSASRNGAWFVLAGWSVFFTTISIAQRKYFGIGRMLRRCLTARLAWCGSFLKAVVDACRRPETLMLNDSNARLEKWVESRREYQEYLQRSPYADRPRMRSKRKLPL
jgi:hypothetical protein